MTTRVIYSHGITVPGPEQFSSVRIDLGVEDDVQAGETLAQATERVRAFVLAEVAREKGLLPASDRPKEGAFPAAAAAGVTPVDDEKFDIDNKVHRTIAKSVMDHLKIKAEYQENKMKYVLKGKRVGDARALLVADRVAYLEKLKADGA